MLIFELAYFVNFYLNTLRKGTPPIITQLSGKNVYNCYSTTMALALNNLYELTYDIN